MKKILVTGGAGFIGSHLCKSLLRESYEVYCLDNYLTGHKKNIKNLLKNKNFKLIEQDVRTSIDIEVDEIYHLACPASPKAYKESPVLTMQIALLGTMKMLDLAKKYKAKIFFASTSEVYGTPEVSPQNEAYLGKVDLWGNRSCYNESKRMGEALCYNYAREYSLDIRVGRIFNTYGPHMDEDDGRVVSNFINQALKKYSLTLYGDGNQTRSFCYIDDMVGAIRALMDSTKGANTPVNLGNPEEITIKQLASQICKLTETNERFLFEIMEGDDPIQRRPDISKAKELLKWEPKVKLEEGLVLTIDYFKNSSIQ